MIACLTGCRRTAWFRSTATVRGPAPSLSIAPTIHRQLTTKPKPDGRLKKAPLLVDMEIIARTADSTPSVHAKRTASPVSPTL